MTIQMQTTRFEFPSVKGFAQGQNRTIFFSGNVQRAVVVVQGFDISYNDTDHHILEERIQLSVNGISGGSVGISASFLLRDSSGNIDDPYSGNINAVVIADVSP